MTFVEKGLEAQQNTRKVIDTSSDEKQKKEIGG